MNCHTVKKSNLGEKRKEKDEAVPALKPIKTGV